MRSGSKLIHALALAFAVVAYSACGLPPASNAIPNRSTEAASAPPPDPAGLSLRIDELPFVEPDPEVVTAVCDPEPGQVAPEAGAATVFCYDGVVLALQAAGTIVNGPITRVFLRRPVCAAVPCSEDELSAVTAVAWTATETVTVRIDSRLDTVSIVPADGLGWPVLNPFEVPEVARPAVEPAPVVVSNRAPYPYCGRALYDSPPQALACFRDSVLLRRPAEVIRDSFGTEGGEVLDVLRFAGYGALTRYELADRRWTSQRGSLILDAAVGSWSFEAWSAGEPID